MSLEQLLRLDALLGAAFQDELGFSLILILHQAIFSRHSPRTQLPIPARALPRTGHIDAG